MVLQILNSSVVKLGDVSFSRNEYLPTFEFVNYNSNGEFVSLNADSRLNIKRKLDNQVVFSVSLKDVDFYNEYNELYTDYSLLLSDLVESFSNLTQVQGAQGPAGPQGPVGPAGLVWQGAWNENNTYSENDAVGFDGASWFCISEVTGTGNDDPSIDTTHWALLASQGAIGPQGPQGPVGAQGPTGLTGEQGPVGPQGVPGTQVVKVLKTTIKPSEVLNLFTDPITILESNNPLTIAYPLNVYIKRNAGNAYTLSANSFSVINDFNTPLTANLNPNPLTSTSEGYFQSAISLSQNLSGGSKNVLYKLKANVGNPTGGTGGLDVYVTYAEITL